MVPSSLVASGGSWPDGQFAEREMCLRRVLAGRAVGRERDVPPAGPGRTGSRKRKMDSRAPRAACPPGKGRRRQKKRERERESRALRAQPAPLARAAGGKTGKGAAY